MLSLDFSSDAYSDETLSREQYWAWAAASEDQLLIHRSIDNNTSAIDSRWRPKTDERVAGAGMLDEGWKGG